MGKLFAAYAAFAVILFGALFAAFFVSGLGEPSEDWSAPRTTAAPAAPGSDTPPLAENSNRRGLDHPSLEAGTLYKVSHRTPMYPSPESNPRFEEMLPERGFMKVEGMDESTPDLWYRVIVSDGQTDFTRYVLARDLNFKRVTPVLEGQQSADSRLEATIAAFAEQRQVLRSRGQAPPPPEPEPERVPQTFDEWWSMTADRIGGAQQATLVASGVAAAVGTAIVICSILLVTFLRRENTWERPATHDGDDELPEAFEEEEYSAASGEAPGERW